MKKRWIRFYVREINELVPSRCFELSLLAWIKSVAKIRSQSIKYKGNLVVVEANQTVTSLRDMAKYFKCDPGKIRRAIDFLSSNGYIRYESKINYSVITVIDAEYIVTNEEDIMKTLGVNWIQANLIMTLMEVKGMDLVEAARRVINLDYASTVEENS